MYLIWLICFEMQSEKNIEKISLSDNLDNINLAILFSDLKMDTGA